MRLSPSLRLARHAVLLAACAAFAAPFVWMVLTSLKPAHEIFAAEWRWLPHDWALVENYGEALSRVPLARYLLNGAIVCAGIFVLQLLVNVPAAYALARLRFRGRDTMFKLVVLGLLVPYHVTAIPLYVGMSHAGLLDTYLALILPFVGSAFGIFLLRQHFKSVPQDLIDAARLDGMGELGLIRRVMLPAALPAISAFAIFSFVAHWNDYFWPLLVITKPELATPPLGIVFFRTEDAGNIQFGPLMAAAVMVTAPLVAAFLLAQRRFIEGMTLAGVKG